MQSPQCTTRTQVTAASVTMTLRLEAEAEKERGSRLGVAGERENERAKEGRSIKELQVQFLFL